MGSKMKRTTPCPPEPQARPKPAESPGFIPRIGAPYTFTPAAFLMETTSVLPGRKPVSREVTGKIIYINHPHTYFTVEYEVNGYKLRQSIKF